MSNREESRRKSKVRLRDYLVSYEKELFGALVRLDRAPLDEFHFLDVEIALRDRNRATIEALATREEWQCDNPDLLSWRHSAFNLLKSLNQKRKLKNFKLVSEEYL